MYKFMYWECTKREGDYGVSSADKVGTQKTAATTTVKVAASTNNGPDGTTGSNTGADGEASSDRGIVNAIWVAHYEQILFYDVTAVSNNDSWGSVEVIGPSGNNAENKVGDQVTLYARTTDYYTMFRGWKRNGEWVRDQQGNIIRDVPYTFTVTEQNKGEYVAQFENGYEFLRIKNRNTGHYISSQQYYPGSASEGELGLMRALSQLVVIDNLPASLDDQGTIARLTKYPRSGSSSQIVHEIEIRGFNTNQFYTVSEGIFLQMSHGTDNTYDIGNGLTTAGVNFHLVERNNAIEGSTSVSSSLNYLWDFEGIDKDLTTKENYYTPGDLIQDPQSGLWYTTHRASWNTKFDTNEIKAYIVTGVNEDGEMELTEVTGGIIPKGVPVLLECQSNDVTRNVMIPTLTAATFTATSGNILKSPEHYYPGEPAPESAGAGQAYFALGITASGNLGFVTQVTNTSTGMNGNRGYYIGPEPVVLTEKEVTLAYLLSTGVEGKKYNIVDGDLEAVAVSADGKRIYCKDDNAYASPSEAENGQVDYVMEKTELMDDSTTWDQSNWIALERESGEEWGSNDATSLPGKTIKNVSGTFSNALNPVLTVGKAPVADQTKAQTYLSAPNNFVTCNFAETVQQGNDGNTYFFVTPKPMEMVQINWAMWDGEGFVVPPSVGASNVFGLSGGFEMGGAGEYNGIMPALEDGTIYTFIGLVKQGESSSGSNAPRRAGAQAPGSFVVYPYSGITEVAHYDGQIITAVNDLQMTKTAVEVGRFNVAGQRIGEDYRGVVIIRMSDGTARKVVVE